jgi:hypothetical protein
MPEAIVGSYELGENIEEPREGFPTLSADRLGGLFARYAGRERYKVTDRLEARVLAKTTKHSRPTGRRIGRRESWPPSWARSRT